MPTSYCFGKVEVRPHERLLLVDGRRAALGSRAFEVLLALIERRDRLVTKDELLNLVWAGLVVEENNLAQHISLVRKTLASVDAGCEEWLLCDQFQRRNVSAAYAELEWE